MTSRQATGGAEVALVGVSRSYGDAQVVADVSLKAPSGEILALLGPSSCGKTTTLRMIAGLVEPSAGDITIDGRSVVDLPVHRRNLGMLFQSYALFPHMNVEDNVAFGLRMRGVPRAQLADMARQALSMVRLTGYEGRMPAALSGGQQQRVALARAIVYRPQVLLLDEPFGALDRKLREEMQIELRQLCTELGLTTILVTHDQDEAMILADQIAVMRGGRIEQAASARSVYERPSTHFVADFIGTSNFLRATIIDRSGGLTRLEAGHGRTFESSLANDFNATDGVAVAIRPESIRLTPGDTSGAVNTVAGPVLRSVFRGQSQSIWLDIGDGAEFAATLPADGMDAASPAPGEVWTASWSADRTLLVREQ